MARFHSTDKGDVPFTAEEEAADSVSGPAATLRQALRDVPTQAGFPWDITWPDAT